MQTYCFHIVCRKYPDIQYDREIEAKTLPQALSFIRRNYKIGSRWDLTSLFLKPLETV